MFKRFLSLLLTAFILVGTCACSDLIIESPAESDIKQDQNISKDTTSNTESQISETKDKDNSNNFGNDDSFDKSNGNTEKNQYITIGGDNPCKIIYADGFSSEADILLKSLKSLDNASLYTVRSDSVAESSSVEVLIGLTNRTASLQAKNSLMTYLDFAINVSDSKIAIYANTSERINDAIQYFISNLTVDENRVLAYPKNKTHLEEYNNYTYSDFKIANESINKFSIVIPANAEKHEKDAALNLSYWIAKNSGYLPSIVLDTVAPYKYEIIIGNADREEISSNFSENIENTLYSASIKNKKLLFYAKNSENYDLAVKAFTDKVKLSNGNLTEFNVKALNGQESDNENNNQEQTPTIPPKKAIFIGNSFIYWGGCVTFLNNDESNESIRQAGGDKGYFNEICKANGLTVDVYNYTYGGQNLDWIYSNRLKNMSSSFLNSIDYVFISEAGQNSSSFKNSVKKIADLFTNAEEIVYLAHEYTFSTTANYIIDALPDLAKQGYKIVAWGELVNDVYNGRVNVPNATLKYNKNTFIKNASGTEKMNTKAAVISISGYGDSFHQNPLSGYITAQMCFSAISGKSAIGQKYDFCWDKTIAPQYDLQNFLTYQYGKNQTSNFIEVFNSSTDMLGLQILMDQYMEKYNK